MKKLYTIILFALVGASANAQAPSYLWAKSAGGTSYDEAYSVTTDASGNIIAAGSFVSATITFGSTTLTNAGGYDLFIVKLSDYERSQYRIQYFVHYPLCEREEGKLSDV